MVCHKLYIVNGIGGLPMLPLTTTTCHLTLISFPMKMLKMIRQKEVMFRKLFPLVLQTYVVEPGDTYESIAETQCRDRTKAREIAIENGLIDQPLAAGQVIFLPQLQLQRMISLLIRVHSRI